MPIHFFENVYYNTNAEVVVHSDAGFTSKIEIHIHEVLSDIKHTFTLSQQKDETTTDLLDESGNILSSLKNTSIQGAFDSITSLIQVIITTCISSRITSLKKTNPQMIAKPCYIHHHQNELRPMAFNGYTPKQIQKAYNVDTSVASKTNPGIVTITIAYTYPNLQKDFDTFCKKYGLPLKKLKIVSLGTEEDSGWAMEECLDVQWVYAMNPNATIQVVEAASSSFDDMFAGVQYASNPPTGSPLKKPDVISMSWGAGESLIQTFYDKYFSDKSICYLASSGDNNFCCYPSTSNNVLSIGGTTLYLDGNNNRTKETTWMSAGCGVSSVFTKPSYQNNMILLNKYKKRVIPDVSGVANASTGVCVVYDGSTYIVGGTSVSCPIMAGILSIAFSYRKELKKKSFTTVNGVNNNLQKFLYNLQKTPQVYTTNFYDIIIGKDGEYQSGKGHDIATGLGVPIGSKLIKTLIDA